MPHPMVVPFKAIIVGHRSQLDLAAVGLAISLANVTGALDLCDARLDFIQ